MKIKYNQNPILIDTLRKQHINGNHPDIRQSIDSIKKISESYKVELDTMDDPWLIINMIRHYLDTFTTQTIRLLRKTTCCQVIVKGDPTFTYNKKKDTF